MPKLSLTWSTTPPITSPSLGSLTSCGSYSSQEQWAGGANDDREKTGYATETDDDEDSLDWAANIDQTSLGVPMDDIEPELKVSVSIRPGRVFHHLVRARFSMRARLSENVKKDCGHRRGGNSALAELSKGNLSVGGEGGIRTHGTVTRTTVFETVPFDHSGTSPSAFM
jgi:hypothetical protein